MAHADPADANPQHPPADGTPTLGADHHLVLQRIQEALARPEVSQRLRDGGALQVSDLGDLGAMTLGQREILFWLDAFSALYQSAAGAIRREAASPGTPDRQRG